ncbi:MAG: IS1182 family transposase [Saprospiraceae bacterium]|nr:IS1182 family transposase [Saprospiraceae bacterium]
MFVNFRLDEHIPKDNFYRILKGLLDLSFIKKKTQFCYAFKMGRPSLDPEVFFKIVLCGYLENMCSDRALERMINMRLDLRFFIDYDIDEKVPDHSTICKTRQRIPTEIFDDVFNHILALCIKEGLVGGSIQSIDSAYINANASIDRLNEIKLVDRDPKDYLKEIREQDGAQFIYGEDSDTQAQKRLKKTQLHLEKHKEYRRQKITKQDGGKTHRKNRRRFLSNATHQSSSDPDARIAKKNGKPRMLCYSSMMSVDTQDLVITHMSAELAHKKDSRYLISTTKQTQRRLNHLGLQVNTILADAGFSSGENYATLEALGLNAFIPVHGTFKEHREDFIYDPIDDIYTCQKGHQLKYRQTDKSGGYVKKRYLSSKKVCNRCPIRTQCVNSRGYKEISHTIYRKHYDDMITKLKSEKGQQTYALRMQSVEPVFGTLQQHYGLRWINTRGLDLANKVMIMAATAVNLKKLVKSIINKTFFAILAHLRSLEPSHIKLNL